MNAKEKKELAAKVPPMHCSGCGKKLKPTIWTTRLHLNAGQKPPAPGDWVDLKEHERQSITMELVDDTPPDKRVELVLACEMGKPGTIYAGKLVLRYWSGSYSGYRSTDANNRPFAHWHTLRCALAFAGAAYHAGYRIKGVQ
jgi:hypothetical protein